MRMRFFKAAAIAAMLLASGCSTTPPSPPSELARSYHEAINLGGRLSVQYQQNGKPQSVQGKFSWMQNSETTHIALLSPLGQTMAKIIITPNQTSLQQAGEPPRLATDINALSTQMLGWPLPVAGLRNWLQGFAVDDKGKRHAAMPNALSNFGNDGWQVRYVSWQGEADAPAYPKRIDMERTTPETGPIALRIVIDNWQPQ